MTFKNDEEVLEFFRDLFNREFHFVDTRNMTLLSRFEEDLGFDSLDRVELLMEIESEFRLDDIPDSIVSGVRTIADAAKLMRDPSILARIHMASESSGAKKDSEAFDDVNNPKHYQARFGVVGMTCIDITRHMDFDLGNAFKYTWRLGDKDNPAKEVGKICFYLEDYFNVLVRGFGYHKPSIGAKTLFTYLVIPNEADTADCYRYKALSKIIELFYSDPIEVGWEKYYNIYSEAHSAIKELYTKFFEKE